MKKLKEQIAEELRYVNWPVMLVVGAVLFLAVFAAVSLAILLFG